jgi:hypothetical protein
VRIFMNVDPGPPGIKNALLLPSLPPSLLPYPFSSGTPMSISRSKRPKRRRAGSLCVSGEKTTNETGNRVLASYLKGWKDKDKIRKGEGEGKREGRREGRTWSWVGWWRR